MQEILCRCNQTFLLLLGEVVYPASCKNPFLVLGAILSLNCGLWCHLLLIIPCLTLHKTNTSCKILKMDQRASQVPILKGEYLHILLFNAETMMLVLSPSLFYHEFVVEGRNTEITRWTLFCSVMACPWIEEMSIDHCYPLFHGGKTWSGISFCHGVGSWIPWPECCRTLGWTCRRPAFRCKLMPGDEQVLGQLHLCPAQRFDVIWSPLFLKLLLCIIF